MKLPQVMIGAVDRVFKDNPQDVVFRSLQSIDIRILITRHGGGGKKKTPG